MPLPIGTPGREPLSVGAREMDEEVQEEYVEHMAEVGARDEGFRHDYARAHPGFFRRLLRRRGR
jgi:hypothetical protein